MLIDSLPLLRDYSDKLPLLREIVDDAFVDKVAGFDAEDQLLLLSLVAAGQGHLLEGDLLKVCDDVRDVEDFYADVGGIIGYQSLVLNKLSASKESFSYEPPKTVDISKENAAIDIGLGNLGELGEIYPVGGAAERLQLRDSGRDMPAAMLHFLSGNLLEGLVRDVEAREFLFFQRFGVQLITPIALMTSHVKQGHAQVMDILEKNSWFGRGRENFKVFSQPLVPAFDERGVWARDKNGLVLKPGGHGVLWKLMEREGVFDWFAAKGRSKALVRQINNPVSGADYGLLSFVGTGFLQEKMFGFATCAPAKHAKEGRVVVSKGKSGACLSNVEYCSFAQHGISETSAFPANANILFCDLEYVREVAREHPFPGMIVNFKNGLARLETTMQNIADWIPVAESYATLHERCKTLSVAKREYVKGEGLLETPLGALFDYLKNGRELLKKFCGMDVPEIGDEESGPQFFFEYHPALGPLYRDIGKKIRGGKLAKGAELCLEISDLVLENLQLDGSLRVETRFVTGHFEGERQLFSERAASCVMRNVKIEGSLKVTLGENSKFIAEDVVIRGDHVVDVPDGGVLSFPNNNL
ncbi:MAG: hypothetical protein ChlgKO_11160 [Chlamydiales bacterium]